MLVKNKYRRIYISLIKKAKGENRVKGEGEYYEMHHILPQALFPRYKNLRRFPKNGVLLTAREHFICHRLLIHMTEGKEREKMVWAFSCMFRRNDHQERLTSRSTVWLKEQMADIMRNRVVSDLTRERMSSSAKTRKNPRKKGDFRHTPESKAKLSKAGKGRVIPEHELKQRSEVRKGVRKSEEHKARIAEAVSQSHQRASEDEKKKRYEKISKASSEWRWITDGEINQRIHMSELAHLPDGFRKGRTLKK